MLTSLCCNHECCVSVIILMINIQKWTLIQAVHNVYEAFGNCQHKAVLSKSRTQPPKSYDCDMNSQKFAVIRLILQSQQNSYPAVGIQLHDFFLSHAPLQDFVQGRSLVLSTCLIQSVDHALHIVLQLIVREGRVIREYAPGV